MVAIVLTPTCRSTAELIIYQRMPRYMRGLTDLPSTPTAKVQKHLLRDAGVCEGKFDREAVRIRLARERPAG